MEITIVGAGNLATNLGVALKKAGHCICQIYSRTEKSAKDLASVLNCPYTTTIEDIVHPDIVIVSIKDDALLQIGTALIDSPSLVVHTAGSVQMDVIKSNRRGVLYPMQTFSKNQIVEFSNIPIFLEASDEECMDKLQALASTISKNTYPLDSEKRRYLHLAAVFACNFTNHCYNLADNILRETGLPFDVMLPLIDETARKVHEMSPYMAQTGPAVRYDRSVISKQTELLTGRTKDIYDIMSKSIFESHDKLRP